MENFSGENQYLIHLVKCAIHGETPCDANPNISLEKVYDSGVLHEIANIAFHSVEKLSVKPDPDLYKKWELKKNLAISRDFNQSFAREEILEIFHQENIQSVEVQGSKIKSLYPSPELRTMSDIDFIVNPDHIKKAVEILYDLGYNCKSFDGFEFVGERAPNTIVELHTDYFSPESPYNGLLPSPFKKTENCFFSVDDFYIYNFLHIAKHYYGRGCGIRRVLDVFYLNNHYKDVINKKYAKDVFKKAQILDFVENISALADCWFNGKTVPSRLNNMADYIFSCHFHGTDQMLFENRLRKTYGEKKHFAKVRYLLKRIFAGNDVMYKHYPFLEKWKILYPFCWIHRLFRGIFNAKSLGILDETKKLVKTDMNKKIE